MWRMHATGRIFLSEAGGGGEKKNPLTSLEAMFDIGDADTCDDIERCSVRNTGVISILKSHQRVKRTNGWRSHRAVVLFGARRRSAWAKNSGSALRESICKRKTGKVSECDGTTHTHTHTHRHTQHRHADLLCERVAAIHDGQKHAAMGRGRDVDHRQSHTPHTLNCLSTNSGSARTWGPKTHTHIAQASAAHSLTHSPTHAYTQSNTVNTLTQRRSLIRTRMCHPRTSRGGKKKKNRVQYS